MVLETARLRLFLAWAIRQIDVPLRCLVLPLEPGWRLIAVPEWSLGFPVASSELSASGSSYCSRSLSLSLLLPV